MTNRRQSRMTNDKIQMTKELQKFPMKKLWGTLRDLDLSMCRPRPRSDAPCRKGESGSGGAGFQTCCVADFQIGGASAIARHAGLETCDIAGSEACATLGSARGATRPI